MKQTKRGMQISPQKKRRARVHTPLQIIRLKTDKTEKNGGSALTAYRAKSGSKRDSCFVKLLKG